MAKDPVCGVEVDEKKAAVKFQYQGKTYVFCAPSCKAKFEKAPEKYVGTGKAGKREVRPATAGSARSTRRTTKPAGPRTAASTS